MNYQNSIAGLFVGMLVGMTGMGGASLMAPILICILHHKTRYAIGADLAYLSIAKTFGAIQHYNAGGVNLKLVGQLCLGSVPASLIGTLVVHYINKHYANANQIITYPLGAVLIVVACILVARSIPGVERWLAARRPERKERGLGWAIAVGVIGGFLVGLTSIGAGTLFGVAFLLIFGLTAREMIGTDITHAAILSTVAAAAHIWAGDVQWGLVASLLVGAIPGILLGGMLSHKMPEGALRPTVATVLFISGVRILL